MLSPRLNLAFPKIIPYKTHSGQGLTPEPVRPWLFRCGPIRFHLILEYRPIPQWFRLKTDTKIQVRYSGVLWSI
jgi:hypothetical protein